MVRSSGCSGRAASEKRTEVAARSRAVWAAAAVGSCRPRPHRRRPRRARSASSSAPPGGLAPAPAGSPAAAPSPERRREENTSAASINRKHTKPEDECRDTRASPEPPFPLFSA